MPAQISDQRDTLRRTLRQRRNRLDNQQRLSRSEQICRCILTLPEYAQSQRTAAYLALASEVSLSILLEESEQIWLPRVSGSSMDFALWSAGQALETSQLGTRQPILDAPSCKPHQLDLVLVPLLGFDLTGNRLGQGGGYYDRTFSFMLAGNPPSPQLWGIAYECQRMPRIPAERWDVPLHGVITEKAIYRCQQN